MPQLTRLQVVIQQQEIKDRAALLPHMTAPAMPADICGPALLKKGAYRARWHGANRSEFRPYLYPILSVRPIYLALPCLES